MVDYEWIGFLAQGFILISFSVSNLKKLRLLNIIGGISWMSYGLLLGSISIIIGNILMVLIHIIMLIVENIKMNIKSDELDNTEIN